MPVTDCHVCGAMMAWDERRGFALCPPCGQAVLTERDALRTALAELVAALSTWRADEPASEKTRLWQQRHDALSAAKALLAGDGGAGGATG